MSDGGWLAPLGPADLPNDWRPADEPGTVVLRFGLSAVDLERPGAGIDRWLILRAPRELLIARRVEEVGAVLAAVERGVAAGVTAAGFLAYEAAPAFDPALRVARPLASDGASTPPLAWFGLYDRAFVARRLPATVRRPYRTGRWRTTVGAPEYTRAIARILEYIEAGDTYQINYTQRLRARWRGDAWALFRALVDAQQCAHAAFVHAGERILCSASPELLLRLDGERLVTRPMKGTRPRGLTPDRDKEQALALLRSAKDRAENVMIVDMARNDLGRVATHGSVVTESLCALERYPTVWQLASTVRARTAAGVPEILGALFPAASITGAPKVRAMEIIEELETGPRGVYTGSVGVWAPGRRAEFSVAIRTVSLDPASGVAEYGTGGGIVWDSRPGSERAETRWKAAVITRRRPRFRLLETILWTPEHGFALLVRHLDRLLASADYFGFAADEEAVRQALHRAARGWRDGTERVVRLLVGRNGRVEVEVRPARADSRARPWTVGWAASSIDARDPFLYHKTTHRAVYERARGERPGFDDVLLHNRRGEVTESTIANLVVDLGDGPVTPPVECGLLAGTLRAELLATGQLRERRLRAVEVRAARSMWLVNSVRGWIPARLLDADRATLPDGRSSGTLDPGA